ncbi:MAG TPA: hypothetical protein VFG53_20300 [Anaeromyxobacter sp.]|nr:hypothetical protein [Anaeromyxobacter sp.]
MPPLSPNGPAPLISIVATVVLLAPRLSLALPSVPPPFTLPPRLDLDRALEILRTSGLDLLVAEATVASAEGDLAAAGAIPNPTLSAGIGHSFLFGHCTGDTGEPAPCPSYPPALSASISDGAALSDSLSGKRGLRLRVAREALAAARLPRDDALRSLEGK